MGVYTEAVQKLYVAYFNRPADVAGLTYWEGVVGAAKGSTAAVSAAFAASAEYKAAYANMDEYHVVAQVYQNLFGHAPDLDGLNFWGQALFNKQLTIDNVVTGIAAGAQGTDKIAYDSKVAAASSFTVALDTPAEVLAYSGDKANGVGKSFIASVTDEASLKAAIADAALAATINAVVDAAPQQVGTTFTLTAGLDNMLGTANNDIFNVLAINPVSGDAATNLSTFDILDGSAGKDTLNLQIAGGKNSITGTVKNIETININADVSTAVDASVFQGATSINQIGTAGNVTKLAAGTTAGFQSISGAAALNVAAAAGAASAAVNFTNVDDRASLTVSGAKLASVTVSGSRADALENGTDALALNVTAGEDVQSLTVTTNQSTVLTVAEAGTSTKHVTSIDASASTAKVKFAGNVDATTIKTGSGSDDITFNGVTAAATTTAAAVNGTVSTGSGNDKITIVTSGDGTISADAGAGNDTIIITKASAAGINVQGGEGNDTVTLAGVLATTDVVNGGAGTDTISLAGAAVRTADDFIVFNKLLTGFETIKFTGAAEAALDVSKLAAAYATIDLSAGSLVTKVGAQALVANGNLTATAAGYAADAANVRVGTLNITEKTDAGVVTANAEIVNLTVKAGIINTAGTLTGDFKTANVIVTNAVDNPLDPAADTIASVVINSANIANATSLTLTGNGSADVTNAAAGKLTTIDASTLGGVYTLGANEGKAIAGLKLVSTETSAETIKLGAGVDKITLSASTYGAVDAISGLQLVANTAGNALTAGSDQLNVSGVTAAAKFTTAQTDLDLALKDAAVSIKGDQLVFTMAGDTYVYVDAGNLGVVDAVDSVVKIVGIVDLDALVLTLNTTIV